MIASGDEIVRIFLQAVDDRDSAHDGSHRDDGFRGHIDDRLRARLVLRQLIDHIRSPRASFAVGKKKDLIFDRLSEKFMIVLRDDATADIDAEVKTDRLPADQRLPFRAALADGSSLEYDRHDVSPHREIRR